MPIAIAARTKLPDEIVTSTTAIVGQRGSGKTFTGCVLAEGMHPLHVPMVIIDPTGVWWGLRVDHNGKDAGLPIAIVGGRHGDVPLREGTGGSLGELVAGKSLSCIIDLSMSKQSEWRPFLLDFFTTLYQNNRAPLHLIIDEADSIVPQKAQRGATQELHDVVDDIVRRGRVKGIGCTLITQRPAVVSKNVLSQIEMLIVMHLTAPQDHKAIEAWVDAHDTENRKKEVIGSLATLKPGDAWLWAPSLELFKRVRIRKRETFDSSSTPKLGEKRKVARSFAEADASDFLKLLQEEEDSKSEESVAPDAGTNGRRPPTPDPSRPMSEIEQEVRTLRRENQKLREELEASVPRAVLEVCRRESHRLRQEMDRRLDAIEIACAKALDGEKPSLKAPASSPSPKGDPASSSSDAPKRAFGQAPSTAAADSTAVDLSPAQRRVLNAVRWWQEAGIGEPSRTQVAWASGYSPKSSSFQNNVSRLHVEECLRYGTNSDVSLTPRGLANSDPPPNGVATEEELHNAILEKLQPRQRGILRYALDLRGGEFVREDLADHLGKSVKSSSFQNDVSNMKSLGLLTYPQQGTVAAAPFLFLA